MMNQEKICFEKLMEIFFDKVISALEKKDIEEYSNFSDIEEILNHEVFINLVNFKQKQLMIYK